MRLKRHRKEVTTTTPPDDCCVRVIDLPYDVPALVSVDAEGYANIYLNARLSRDAQMRGFRHEVDHINDDDVFSDSDIFDVEGSA